MKDDPELGPLVADYKGRGLRRSTLLTLVLPSLLAAGLPLAYGAWRYNVGYTRYGPVAAELWSRPWFVLSLASLAGLVVVLLARLLGARRSVAVHKGGVAVHSPLSRRRSLPWNQIAGIVTAQTRQQLFGLPLRTSRRAILLPNAGPPVRLTEELQNLPELLSRLKAGLYPRLAPRLMENFQAGQWLYFGPLSIHPQGLRLERRQRIPIPWSGVRRMQIQAGCLVIEYQDSAGRMHLKRIPVDHIPNIELLLQVVQQGVKA